MASTDGIQPVQISTPAAVEHQSLADKFYALFKGAEAYVEKWLPEHENKQHVLAGIQATWDNTVSVIKGDLAATEQSAQHDAEQLVTTAKNDAESVAAEAVPAAEKASEDALSGVESAVSSVAQEIPAPPTTPAE